MSLYIVLTCDLKCDPNLKLFEHLPRRSIYRDWIVFENNVKYDKYYPNIRCGKIFPLLYISCGSNMILSSTLSFVTKESRRYFAVLILSTELSTGRLYNKLGHAQYIFTDVFTSSSELILSNICVYLSFDFFNRFVSDFIFLLHNTVS